MFSDGDKKYLSFHEEEEEDDAKPMI